MAPSARPLAHVRRPERLRSFQPLARSPASRRGFSPASQPRSPKDGDSGSDTTEKSSRLAFVGSRWFQGTVGVVIFLNAIIIGAELELDFEGWWLVEFLLLLFFSVELCLRCCYYGWNFWFKGGNLFDMLIVVSGVVDSWIIPTFSWLFLGRRHHGNTALGEVAQLLRLGRIFRLVRLVKIIQPLYRLALGIAEAVQGMFWVLVFLMMMLYAAAILCTRLLGSGHGEAPGMFSDEEPPAVREVREMFHSVQSSLFVLFEMMSCWSLMRFVPLFREYPITRLLAVCFYILTAWALLAVMTGVVSEKMLAVKEALNLEEKNRAQVRRHIAGEKLRDLFQKVDLDGSGTISWDEFNNMLLCTNLSKVLMEYSQVTTEELTEVFVWLDHDRNGVVDIAEFIKGFNWLNEHMSPKSFLKFQEDASRTIKNLEKSLVATVNRHFDQFVSNIGAPLRKLSVVADQVQFLEAILKKAEYELEQIPDEVWDPEFDPDQLEVALVESRLAARIDKLLVAVESFEERYEEEKAVR